MFGVVILIYRIFLLKAPLYMFETIIKANIVLNQLSSLYFNPVIWPNIVAKNLHIDFNSTLL